MDRDWNAAINILKSALSTVGHTGTWVLDPNALGDSTSTLAGEILSEQVGSMNKESPRLDSWGVSKSLGFTPNQDVQLTNSVADAFVIAPQVK